MYSKRYRLACGDCFSFKMRNGKTATLWEESEHFHVRIPAVNEMLSDRTYSFCFEDYADAKDFVHLLKELPGNFDYAAIDVIYRLCEGMGSTQYLEGYSHTHKFDVILK